MIVVIALSSALPLDSYGTGWAAVNADTTGLISVERAVIGVDAVGSMSRGQPEIDHHTAAPHCHPLRGDEATAQAKGAQTSNIKGMSL